MTFNLLAQIQPSHWLIAAMLVAIGTILFRSQRKAQDVGERRKAVSPSPSGAAVAGATRSPDQSRWEVEMHELTRDFTARIDSKLAVLEQLLRAAHHESLRLETALSQASQLTGQGLSPATPSAVEFQPSSNQAQRLEEQTHRHPQASRLRAAGPGERPFDCIYALADRGCDIQTIAEQIPCPIGEVELILSLRRRSQCS